MSPQMETHLFLTNPHIRGRFDLAPECLDYSQAAALNLTDF